MVKALLIGVSEYADPRNNLPKCLNDLYAMRKALNVGLNTNLSDMLLCGEGGSVSVDEYKNAFKSISKTVNVEESRNVCCLKLYYREIQKRYRELSCIQ